MNNGPLLFLGIFCTIAFSWTGIVWTNLVQQREAGATLPAYDAENSRSVPAPLPGLAEQGRKVYQDLGCLYCHSQQVRNSIERDPNAVSPDVARGWGSRPNSSRDYIYDGRLMLGTMRTGPDLRNVGMRLQDPNWHHLHLYNPRITTPPTASGIAGSIMPPFPFLYETRKIVGEPSRKALRLTGEHAPPPGYEVIPTARAEALVAYLLSLKTDYSLPESPIREP